MRLVRVGWLATWFLCTGLSGGLQSDGTIDTGQPRWFGRYLKKYSHLPSGQEASFWPHNVDWVPRTAHRGSAAQSNRHIKWSTRGQIKRVWQTCGSTGAYFLPVDFIEPISVDSSLFAGHTPASIATSNGNLGPF